MKACYDGRDERNIKRTHTFFTAFFSLRNGQKNVPTVLARACSDRIMNDEE